MDYVILLGTDPSSLSSQVNARIRDGWIPQGGVVVVTVRDEEAQEEGQQWAQAMTKQETSE
jgi:hypothetical protein